MDSQEKIITTKITKIKKGVIKTPTEQITEIHSILADMNIIITDDEQWHQITEHFEPTELSGGFSTIFKGTYLGKPALLKRLTSIVVIESEVLNYALAQMGCPENFCRLLKVYISQTEPIRAELLMDNCGISLEEKLKSKEDVNMKQRVKYIIQVCESLQCLHELNIKHLDIKPLNIVIDTQDKAKIIDFGLSRFDYTQDPTKPRIACDSGTAKYIPFEIFNKRLCKKQSDIFSLGLTIMITLDLFDINDYNDIIIPLNTLYLEYSDQIINKIEQNPGVYSILHVFANTKQITREQYANWKLNSCFKMIESMLLMDFTQRPNINEVLSFFKEYYEKI